MIDRPHELSSRRYSETHEVVVTLDGRDMKLLVTFGFDHEGKVREVFCASFKAGTSMNVLVQDACVLTSLLFQHGYTAQALFETLAQGPSLIGVLVRSARDAEEKAGIDK